MECQCTTATEFYGTDAEAYLAEHLQSEPGDTYVCADTGRRWRVDESDPAQARLIQL